MTKDRIIIILILLQTAVLPTAGYLAGHPVGYQDGLEASCPAVEDNLDDRR